MWVIAHRHPRYDLAARWIDNDQVVCCFLEYEQVIEGGAYCGLRCCRSEVRVKVLKVVRAFSYYTYIVVVASESRTRKAKSSLLKLLLTPKCFHHSLY
jgi:hypothetical protein